MSHAPRYVECPACQRWHPVSRIKAEARRYVQCRCGQTIELKTRGTK